MSAFRRRLLIANIKNQSEIDELNNKLKEFKNWVTGCWDSSVYNRINTYPTRISYPIIFPIKNGKSYTLTSNVSYGTKTSNATYMRIVNMSSQIIDTASYMTQHGLSTQKSYSCTKDNLGIEIFLSYGIQYTDYETYFKNGDIIPQLLEE